MEMGVMSGVCRSTPAWNKTWIRKNYSSILQTMPACSLPFRLSVMVHLSGHLYKSLLRSKGDVHSFEANISGCDAFLRSSGLRILFSREWKAWWFHSLLEQVGERSCRARGSKIPKRPEHGQLVRLTRAISQRLSCTHSPYSSGSGLNIRHDGQ